MLPFPSGAPSAPWLGLARSSLDLPAKMALPRALPGSDPQDMAGWGSGPWSPETGNFEMGTSELPPNLQYSHPKGGQGDIWCQINPCQVGCDAQMGFLCQREGMNSGIVPSPTRTRHSPAFSQAQKRIYK